MEPEKSILREFLNGGWLVPLVGAAAMFARLLSANSGLSLKQQFKRVATAAIAAGIAWFVLEQTDVSSLAKAVTYGIIGVISPEVISGIVRLGEKFAKNPEKFIKR
tara:strand:- start:227 stop:544 length:318 start_codon:yes stop_codon:yes gene_type:complete